MFKTERKMKRYLTSIQSYEYSYEQSSNTSVKFLLFVKRRRLPQIQHSPCVPHHTSQLSMTKSLIKEDVMESLSEIKLTERGKRSVVNEHLLKLMSGPEFHHSISLTATDLDRYYHISHVTSDWFWVSDYQSNLILTNTAGETLHHLKDCCSIFPINGYGIHTVNSESELFYIDMDSNINKLSKDMKTNNLFVERTDSTWKPQCVHWSPSTGDLLVGMFFYNHNDSTCKMSGKVNRYNNIGQLTQTIQEDNKGQKMFSYPICITENNNGDVVVSDSDAVIVTECGGRHRFSYTGHPSGSIPSPCGICTDALSHILVCDIRTNTVQIIDIKGQFLSHLLIRPSGIFTPSCLSYDISTHLLLVGSSTNKKMCLYRYITRQEKMTGQNQAALNMLLSESLSEIQVSKTEKQQEGNESLLKLMSPPQLLHSLTVTDVDYCEHISCVTSDQVWVGDDNLILINTAGDILHRLKNLCFEIYSGGIQTVNSEGELIYIDEDYNINKLSNDMKITTTIIERKDSTWEPHCVFWSPSNGDLLVGMYREDTRIGKVTREQLYNGDVVVSDSLRAVVVTERGGRHRFSYTGHPSGSGLSPCRICTDALSHILLCDIRTNTIQIINKNGQFLSYLLTKSEEIDEPRSLCYDVNTHRLWVGSDYNNKLCVYRYITQQANTTAEHGSCSDEEAFSCSRPA